MHYKTIIEVCTDAESKDEAADIAGEYLRGNIADGANLRVHTESLKKSRTVKAALFICSAIAIASAFLAGNQVYSKMAMAEKKEVTSYAIQPPLSTNLAETEGQEFRKAWQNAQTGCIDSMTR